MSCYVPRLLNIPRTLLNACYKFSTISNHVDQALSNLSCVFATIFSSLAFLSTSVSMTNLSCLLVTTLFSLGFSPTHFHHLASIFWEWPGAVSRGLLLLMTFSSSSFRFFDLLLALSFSRLILSLSLLCSSVTEALFAFEFHISKWMLLFFSFFFDHAKAAPAYSSLNE